VLRTGATVLLLDEIRLKAWVVVWDRLLAGRTSTAWNLRLLGLLRGYSDSIIGMTDGKTRVERWNGGLNMVLWTCVTLASQSNTDCKEGGGQDTHGQYCLILFPPQIQPWNPSSFVLVHEKIMIYQNQIQIASIFRKIYEDLGHIRLQ
jgi:hypothetical protein